jgi:ribosome-binding factor A
VVFLLDRGLEKGGTVLSLLQQLEQERRQREDGPAAPEAD